MGVPREPTYSLLVIACFSRHLDALQWAVEQLVPRYGTVLLTSPDFSFHHTKYYDKTMGTGLVKRLLVFEPIVYGDCLPEVKRFTIGLEEKLAASGRFPEVRPLNLDPGLLQLGKFLLASTKDQVHRIELRDGIFAEITLRYDSKTKSFDVWPWTYADYREPAVLGFLNDARGHLYERVVGLRALL
jgi:hypothetical protein